ncbi:MAG: DEAD/DEAH box helicase family protein [Chlamydiia bacterium]|nr:DEAD/DEAH box helicase family protein [Chlamydiia bacterium]
MIVVNKKPISTRAASVYPWCDKLQKQFSMVSRYEEPIQMYRELGKGDNKRILLPRGMCPLGEDLRVNGLPVKFTSSFVPRNEDQQRVVTESNYLLDKGESFVVRSYTGCVDGDTEYFTGTGWKKISQYDGGLIGQYNKTTGGLEVVKPEQYIKLPCDTLSRIHTKYGLDMVLSDEHTVLYYPQKFNEEKQDSFFNIKQHHHNTQSGFRGRIKTTFTCKGGVGYPITDANLRLQIAVMADGYISCPSTTRVVIRLKKSRKKIRLVTLLNAAKVSYDLLEEDTGFSVFKFYAPLGIKKFTPGFYNCTPAQLEIINEEVVYWDGDQKNRYFTSIKTNADFIQYVFTCMGYRASIITTNRIGTKHYKSLEYSVIRSKRTLVSWARSTGKLEIQDYKTKDGFKYCFSTPSGYLVLRRSNNIFVTGNSGKTIMAMAMIANVGKKTIIVVTKEDIRDQWIAAAKMVLGLSMKDIGLIQADVCAVKGKKIVIAMIQSLSKSGKYPSSTWSDFGLAVYDEVHLANADQFSNSIWLMPAKLRLGLSATPERKDGKDIVVRGHIGETRVVWDVLGLVPNIIVKRSGFLLPMVTRKIKGQFKRVKLPHVAGRTNHVNKYLAHDKTRNKLIIDFLLSAYKKDRIMIVFSELKTHLDILYEMAIMRKIPMKDMGFYVGGMKKAEREEAKGKRILFATYAMVSTGTDIPWLDTAILGTPRSDVVQIVGRVLREYPDKKKPIVFDIVDMDSSVFSGYYQKRIAWYSKIGSTVIRHPNK